MRILALVSLLIALLAVALLSRHQLAAVRVPASDGAAASRPDPLAAQNADTADQARQVQQQVRDDVNKMMQDRAAQVEQGLEGK